MKMWRGVDDKGIIATCIYSPEKKEYIVSVSHEKSKKEYTQNMPCFYEPIFGMDVMDMSESQKLAEKLAHDLEIEQGI